MRRRISTCLILPFLFALLAAGGKATVCEVLSVLGLEAHHHEVSDCHDHHEAPICLNGADHDHAPAPCPTTCELRLDDATTPVTAKVPALCVSQLSDWISFLPAPEPVALPDRVSQRPIDPPDRRSSLLAPPVTGRFLI